MNREDIKKTVTKENFKNFIFKLLRNKDNGKFRKEIIEEYIKKQNLSKKELSDNSPSSILTNIKSLIGTFISDLLKNKTLIIKEEKK